MKAHLRISVKDFLKSPLAAMPSGLFLCRGTIAANNTNRTMRFNPHAFKRANVPDTASTSVVTDAIAATSADALPSSILHPPSSMPPALAAFIAAYGRPGANQIPVPEGSMAVTLSLKFNDSAPQVDHFDYHAGLGCPDFLLLLVKKQGAKARFAQTESLARKALTACPELHSLDWTWKSEKYAGGHGNYLQSSYFPTPCALKEHITVRKTFGNGGPDAVSWEIQFANAAPRKLSGLQLWPHKHYGAPVVQSPFSNGRHDSGCNAVTAVTAAWCLNERMRGVEIHFTRRPDDAALAPLRGDRAWRYTGKTKCWYTHQTPETIAWAKTFCENFNGGSARASRAAADAPSTAPGAPSRVVAPPSIPTPRLPSVASERRPACQAEASERRLERKFIRFADPIPPIIPMLPMTPSIADLMRPKV